MATPSLAMGIGYKATKLYSILPEDATGDFDVTRATTATRVNKSGLIEEVGVNVPRLDYSDGGCPVLLTEPQSTNLVTYSEDFSNWSVNNSSVTSNIVSSPSGDIDADKIVENNNNSQHRIDLATSSAISTNVFSVFLKKGEREYAWLRIGSSGAFFNLNNGEADVVESGIFADSFDYGDGWYRCIIKKTSVASNEICRVNIIKTQGLSDYQGDGTSGIYIWGAQLEELSYPTSYIKTEGSVVTRNADVINNAGDSSTFNSSEGVLYAEIAALFSNGSNRAISLSSGEKSNSIRLFYNSAALNEITMQIRVGDSVQAIKNAVLSNPLEFNKIAVKYKENDFALWVNGVEEAIDTSGVTFPTNTLNELSFNNGNTGGDKFYGKTKDIRVYKTVLTDAELIELTS